MAKLTQEEADQLAALQAKAEAPDEEPKENGGGISRVLNIGIDLGDEAQVKRAIGLGLLTEPELEELEGEDKGGGGGGEDEGPKRRGFFPES